MSSKVFPKYVQVECIDNGRRLDRRPARDRCNIASNDQLNSASRLNTSSTMVRLIIHPTRLDHIRIGSKMKVDFSGKEMMDQTLRKKKETLWKRHVIFLKHLRSFICRHHVMNRKIKCAYIDVVRHTQTNLDILQENKIVNYWKADRERRLSGS